MLLFIDVSLSHTSDVMQIESKVSFFLSLIRWHPGRDSSNEAIGL